jgi:predicted amidohydrolase
MDDSMRLKIAGVQMEPRILEKERNLARCLELIQEAAALGSGLIVFPECALTGYMYSSLQEALPVCEPVPGPSTMQITGLCRDLNVYVVVGLLDIDGDNCYNSAVLLGPEGLLGRYRKLHLPYLGIDRFISRGSSIPDVFDTPIGRIGIGICYDAMFPEHARIVNRVGEERGSRFIGHSIIAHCGKGTALATGQPGEETTIYAEIDTVQAREKHVIINPGEFEVDVLKDRRPELYNAITTPLDLRNSKHVK